MDIDKIGRAGAKENQRDLQRAYGAKGGERERTWGQGSNREREKARGC